MNKDKQSSFREKLENILEDSFVPVNFDGQRAWYDTAKAHKAILALVKSIVPDETPEPSRDDCDWQLELAEKAGHDICRQEILDKLGS